MKGYIIKKGPLYANGKDQTIEGVRRPILVKSKIEAKIYKNGATAARIVKNLNLMLKPQNSIFKVKEIRRQTTKE